MTYTYDSMVGGNFGKGRLTGIVDESGSATIVYDRRGNELSETRVIEGASFATSYARNLADRLLKVTYPSGRIVGYALDLDRVDPARDAGANPALLDTLREMTSFRRV